MEKKILITPNKKKKKDKHLGILGITNYVTLNKEMGNEKCL